MNEIYLPSITECLNEKNQSLVNFVRPNFKDGSLTEIHRVDSPGSPATKVMRVRTIMLTGESAIPFHVHERKEKMYYLLTDTKISFFLYVDGVFKQYSIDTIGQSFVIPPNTPHALYFAGSKNNILKNEVVLNVVISSQDDADIKWEPNADNLVKNRHLKEV